MTENMYQMLRTFIPPASLPGDSRSIHFLRFPEVKQEYFDAVIERQVRRMQTVIELTRNLREKNNLSLKVSELGMSCVLRLVLIHRSADTSQGTACLPPRCGVPLRCRLTPPVYPVRAQRSRCRLHIRRREHWRTVPRCRRLGRAWKEVEISSGQG